MGLLDDHEKMKRQILHAQATMGEMQKRIKGNLKAMHDHADGWEKIGHARVLGCRKVLSSSPSRHPVVNDMYRNALGIRGKCQQAKALIRHVLGSSDGKA